MTALEKDIISIIRGVIEETTVVISDDFDLAAAVRLCRRHGILPILYAGLSRTENKPDKEKMSHLRRIAASCIIVDRAQLCVVDDIKKAFAENGIPFMPLKGLSVKPKYSHSEYRLMGDCDFLIGRKEAERAAEVLSELGFAPKRDGDRQSEWKSKEGITVELHTGVVSESNGDFVRYWGDGWDFARPTGEGSSEYRMSSEDEFDYLITHLAKHFRNGGVGLRHFTDIYVYEKSEPDMDRDYINEELGKLGLRDFYENIKRTLATWFMGGEEDETTARITEFVMRSGSFGTADGASVSDELKRRAKGENKSRKKRLLSAVFLPYGNMCGFYPVLEKAPVLLPLFWVVRLFDRAFVHRKKAKKTITGIMVSGSSQVDEFRNMLTEVGLSPDFGHGIGLGVGSDR